jgi:hypothetical protein
LYSTLQTRSPDPAQAKCMSDPNCIVFVVDGDPLVVSSHDLLLRDPGLTRYPTLRYLLNGDAPMARNKFVILTAFLASVVVPPAGCCNCHRIRCPRFRYG